MIINNKKKLVDSHFQAADSQHLTAVNNIYNSGGDLDNSSTSESFTSSHTLYQGDSYEHTLRKDMTGVHIKSISPMKCNGHTQSEKGCSHIGTPLQEVPVSPKFRGIES